MIFFRENTEGAYVLGSKGIDVTEDLSIDFKVIQKKGKISQKEMYSVFNMGIGMILVVDKNQTKKIKQKLDKKVKAHIIGRVVKSARKLVLL